MLRLILFLSCVAAWAQAPLPKSFFGTVVAFKPESAEIVMKPDNLDAVTITMNSTTVFQRVAPGAKDLKGAEPAKATDMSIGDKVLVTLEAGTKQARRMVIMSATDIAKRDEADKADWQKRGVAGVVASKTGSDVVLKTRTMTGQSTVTVTVAATTKYHRYSPDSVKFLDAKSSKIDEVSVGDQLRARGTKSEDGTKVTAEEVVFGTFVTKAGTIVSIDAEKKEIAVTEYGTNKPLTIKFTADSQIKKMPNFAGMGAPGMTAGGGGRGEAGPGGNRPAGAAPGAGAGGAPGAGRMPDLAQMLDRIPPSKLDDLKPGEQVIVSSTKGATPSEVTAITLVGNAAMVIQMATMQSAGAGAGAGAGRGAGGGMGMGGGGMGMGGLEGLNLPGIQP